MFLNQKNINLNAYRNQQKGSALVIAIVIIVVMSLLGVALVRMLSSSNEAVAYEVIGTRAYTAAQTGAQWQLMRTFPLNNAASECALNVNMPLADIDGLSNCVITVDCSSTDYDNVTFYTITSNGQCSAGHVITSRIVEIEARNL
jgi:MSHA biogenesis protein MshP